MDSATCNVVIPRIFDIVGTTGELTRYKLSDQNRVSCFRLLLQFFCLDKIDGADRLWTPLNPGLLCFFLDLLLTWNFKGKVIWSYPTWYNDVDKPWDVITWILVLGIFECGAAYYSCSLFSWIYVNMLFTCGILSRMVLVPKWAQKSKMFLISNVAVFKNNLSAQELAKFSIFIFRLQILCRM